MKTRVTVVKLSILSVAALFLVTASPIAHAEEVEDSPDPDVTLKNDEEQDNYDVGPQEATGTHLINTSYTTKKGASTYLGTVTKKKGFTANMSATFKGVTISLGASTSESGKFKKYKRNIKVTLKGTKIENGSGKNLGNVTYTSNGLSYVEYVPI